MTTRACLKIMVGCCCVLMAIPLTTSAQVYTCTTLAGAPFFTDNKGLFPQGCRLDLDRPSSSSTGLSVFTSLKSDDAISSSDRIDEILQVEIRQQRYAQQLTQQAERLVDRFYDLRAEKFLDARGNLRIEYRRELREIQLERNRLMGQSVDLTNSDQERINTLLAAIPG